MRRVMRFKCSHCRERSLIEKVYDGELHCSHAVCESCGAKLILWYDDQEQTVMLVEDDEGGHENG